ncbi:MAG: hypothetical protein JWQ87_993 [Candidatus Sulfotelmatobacter sp.]|nr:hypothetical protein [Candidatus Sulfotelmatobacter sp.]
MRQSSNVDQASTSPEANLLRTLPVVLRECWSRETSYDPEKWTPENPTHGQCAITALVIQDLLGGDLLRAKVNGAEHYWNCLPDLGELDLTRDQFGTADTITTPEKVSREYVLSFSNTVRRYEQLSQLFTNALKEIARGKLINARRSIRGVSSARKPKSRKLR